MLRFLSFYALAALAVATGPSLPTLVKKFLNKDNAEVGNALADAITTCTNIDFAVGGLRNWAATDEFLNVQTVLREEGTGGCFWLAIAASKEGELLACELGATTVNTVVYVREHRCKKTSGGFQGDIVEAAKANFATMPLDTHLQPNFVYAFKRPANKPPGVGSSVKVTLQLPAQNAVFCDPGAANGKAKMQNFLDARTALLTDAQGLVACKLINLAPAPNPIFGVELVFVVTHRPSSSGRRLEQFQLFQAADLAKFCANGNVACGVVKDIQIPNLAFIPKQIAKKENNDVKVNVGVKEDVVKEQVAPALESTPGDIGEAKKLAKANEKFELNTLKGIGGTASVACVACVLLLAVGILIVKVRNSRNDTEEEIPLTDPVE